MNYQASLMIRPPAYVTLLPKQEGKKVTVIPRPLEDVSNKPAFDNWNAKDYAQYLEHYWSRYQGQFKNVQITDIYKEPNQVLSFLFNEDGTIKQMKI